MNHDQSHDAAIFAVAALYFDYGLYCWVNPGEEKNKSWNKLYVDVIVARTQDEEQQAWLIEFETGISVSETQAQNKWKQYAQAYSRWYLAVPVNVKDKAAFLLNKYHIDNCSLITWGKTEFDDYFFYGLPCLPKGEYKKHSFYKTLHHHKGRGKANTLR